MLEKDTAELPYVFGEPGPARSVRVPTFLYQVRGDLLTDPSDVQAMFDNIPIAEKRLQWIEGTTARWDGYMEFQRRPQPMLDWFANYLVPRQATLAV